MGAKRLSLADRIREQKKKNRPASEAAKEKALIDKITPISVFKEEKAGTSTGRQTTQQVDKPTPRQLSKQLSKQVDNSTGRQTPKQVKSSTTQHVDTSTSQQTPRHLDNSTSQHVEPEAQVNRRPQDLKDNQYRVLEYIYFNRPFKISGPEGLWVKLGIRYGTVRENIRSLENKGYIEPHFSINDGLRKGVNCRVVESKCLPLFGPCPIVNPTQQVDTSTSRHLNTSTSRHQPQQVDTSTGQQTPWQVDSSYNSSSSLLNKTTTNAFQENPELGYWRQKGLKPKQISNWIQEFQIPEEDIVESLCYCKFDMVDNDRETKEDIKDVFAWFYKIVKRAGAYPKPKNYKSHQDKLLERERRRTEERKKQAEELRQARQDAVKAQYELEFEQMLQDPEDPTHQKCRETLLPILRKPGKQFTNAYEAAMKRAFCTLKDIEDC